MIHFISEDMAIPELNQTKVQSWIQLLTASHQKKLGEINYIFCSDPKIIEVNRQYLGHDYYTDIITFDYTEGIRIAGDLFIGVETVASNTEQYSLDYQEEMLRILAHGVLHLCGFKDKQPEEEKQMREEEAKALALWRSF